MLIVLWRITIDLATSTQTQAMIISTQHLLPSALPTPTAPQDAPSVTQIPDTKEATPNGIQPEAASESADNAPGMTTGLPCHTGASHLTTYLSHSVGCYGHQRVGQ